MTDTATTKKIVTTVDKAVKGINAAMATASKTMADLSTMVATSEDLAFNIETASNKLAAIESDTTAALRDAKADLAIRIKENADLVLTSMLRAGKLARISDDEVAGLQKELSDALEGNAAELGKAVGMAVSKAEAAGKLTLSEANATAAIAAAQRDADNTALNQQVNFLQQTITTLENNAKAEREARVAIAATTAAPTVNVSSAK